MLWTCEIQGTQCMIFMQKLKESYTVKPDQAYPPPPPTQDAINEFIIWNLNVLVVVDFRFISAFLHA